LTYASRLPAKIRTIRSTEPITIRGFLILKEVWFGLVLVSENIQKNAVSQMKNSKPASVPVCNVSPKIAALYASLVFNTRTAFFSGMSCVEEFRLVIL
jgi:hypothetical protein